MTSMFKAYLATHVLYMPSVPDNSTINDKHISLCAFIEFSHFIIHIK